MGLADSQNTAQQTLTLIELDLLQYPEDELIEFEALRSALRLLVQKHGAAAELAILAVGLESAIRRDQ